MKNKNVVLGVAAAVCLFASPAFAAKTSLDNAQLGNVTGKANAYTFGGPSSMTVESSIDTTSNASFGMYQWSDTHSTDTSLHKGANNQSGDKSNVQGNVNVRVNSLAWGWISQTAIDNTGKATLTGGAEINMAYGTTAMGGF